MGELSDRVRRRIWDKVKQILSGERVASPDHIQRMTRWCEILGPKIGADMQTLVAGALIHDLGVTVDRRRHYIAGKELGREVLLEAGLPEGALEGALHVMECHSRYGGPEPKTVEARVARDADALEYLGAIGIVRAVVRGLTDGSFSGKAEDFPEFLFRLIESLRGTFQLEDTRKIGEERIRFMEQFLCRIKEELSFKL